MIFTRTNASEFQHHSQTKQTNNLIYCTLYVDRTKKWSFTPKKVSSSNATHLMEFQTPLVFSGQKVKAGTTITMPLRPPADMVCALSFPTCSKVGSEITEFLSEIQWRIYWIVGNFGLEWYHWYLVFVAFFRIFHRNWNIWNDRKTNLFDWWAQYWIQCRCCHVGSPFVGQSMCCCPDEISLASWEQKETNPTPWKINMQPTNHPFRKENDLPNLHYYVPC